MTKLTAGRSIRCPFGVYLAALPAAYGAGSLDGLLACRHVSNPEERLACFDRAAGAAADTRGSPAPLPDAKQSFGLPDADLAAKEVAAGVRPAPLPRIDAHVSQIMRAADGLLVFTLDNGQVWRQSSPAGEMLAKQGDAIIVKRGALGSYWLAFPSGRDCKVTRLH